jgi:hypothetical protein
MVDIPRSKREVISQAVTRSGDLPQPSGARIGAAGAVGRGIAGFGDVLQELGRRKLAADDALELESANIELNRKAQEAIDNNLTIQNPTDFEAKAIKDFNTSIKDVDKSIGGRNRDEFGLVVGKLRNTFSKTVRDIKTKKRIDLGSAQRKVKTRQILSSVATNLAIAKDLGEIDDAIDIAVGELGTFLNIQTNTGLLSVSDATTAILNGRRDMVEIAFDTLLIQGKVAEAKEFLDKTTFLEPNEKLDIKWKSTTRINKIEKKINDQLKVDQEKLEGQYIEESLKGTLEKEGVPPGDITDLSLDSLIADRNTGKIGKETFKQAWKNQAKIVDAGGLGDEALMNELLTDIADDIPDNPIIDSGFISRLQESDTFNNIQERTLRAAIVAKREDIERRLNSPSAREERSDIKRQYRVSGLIGSRSLKDEALRKFSRTMNLYNDMVKQGTEPRQAKLQAFQTVGPVPGRAEISETALIRLKEEEISFSNRIQEMVNSRTKRTREQIKNDEITVQAFQDEITNMEQELRLIKELEQLGKTQ